MGGQLLEGIDEFIATRKDRSLNELVSEHPQYVRNGEVGGVFHSERKDSPAALFEYYFWDELQNEFYWDSFNYLATIFLKGGDARFSKEDFEKITRIMVEQILEGKKPVSGAMYSDVWLMLRDEGNDLIHGKKSPLEKYVTDEDIRFVPI